MPTPEQPAAAQELPPLPEPTLTVKGDPVYTEDETRAYAAQAIEAQAGQGRETGPEYCPHCGGSGEVRATVGGGPDAYEEEAACPHCNGEQTLAAAYAGVLGLLKAEHDKYLKACGDIWSSKHLPSAAPTPPVSAAPAPAAAVPGWRTIADALRPFADIGAWLFARPLPDDTPMVDLHGLNSQAGALTRGHFKAAHTALQALEFAAPTPPVSTAPAEPEPVYHLRSYGDVTAAQMEQYIKTGKIGAPAEPATAAVPDERAAVRMSRAEWDRLSPEAQKTMRQAVKTNADTYRRQQGDLRAEKAGIPLAAPLPPAAGSGPSDEEIDALWRETWDRDSLRQGERRFARALLSRYGTAGAEARDALTAAARDVLAERRRQVEVEGWTPKHDDEQMYGMPFAAAAYAVHAHAEPAMLEALWVRTGWSRKWFKPKDPRRDLIRAGALILAEIDRLDRAQQAAAGQTEGGEHAE